MRIPGNRTLIAAGLGLRVPLAHGYELTAKDLCGSVVRQMTQAEMPSYPVSDAEFAPLLEVGIVHDTGRGVPKDRKQAMQWYERAARAGWTWAEVRLGAMYAEDGNHAAALAWWRRAADRGDGRALNNLGVMHEKGQGVPADVLAAVDCYLRAAAVGSAEARSNLDAIYEEGRGAPSGTVEAIAWYRKGADLGISSAAFKLGQLHERPGPTQDFVAARRAYDKAGDDPRAWRAQARLAALGLGAPEGSNPVANAYAAQLLLAHAEKLPPRVVRPAGLVLDPGADPQRTMQVRVAGVPVPQAAAGDVEWSLVILPPRAGDRGRTPK
jgi:TPR repeat protein